MVVVNHSHQKLQNGYHYGDWTVASVGYGLQLYRLNQTPFGD